MNNLFKSIPPDINQEVFESIIDSQHVKIERIISKGHSSPESGWYDQDHHEWVVVLSGEAIIAFTNDTEINLKQGDYLNIPANTKHRVKWTLPDKNTIWLAIHY